MDNRFARDAILLLLTTGLVSESFHGGQVHASYNVPPPTESFAGVQSTNTSAQVMMSVSGNQGPMDFQTRVPGHLLIHTKG
jgi:hypothetical protein